MHLIILNLIGQPDQATLVKDLQYLVFFPVSIVVDVDDDYGSYQKADAQEE